MARRWRLVPEEREGKPGCQSVATVVPGRRVTTTRSNSPRKTRVLTTKVHVNPNTCTHFEATRRQGLQNVRCSLVLTFRLGAFDQ
jgi:hypothetical protein